MLNQTEGLQRIVEIVEDEIGEVVSTEEQCPGVYYVACKPEDEATEKAFAILMHEYN